MQEDERDLLTAFVNTIGLDDPEQLATPADLAAWLAGHGLAPLGLAPTARELRETRAFREALRDLMYANSGEDVDTAAAGAVIARVSRRARLCVDCCDEGAKLEPQAEGVPGALGRICVAFERVSAAGTWKTVKACRARDCIEAFVDRAPNGRKAFCGHGCGNREKVRAYRERQDTTKRGGAL